MILSARRILHNPVRAHNAETVDIFILNSPIFIRVQLPQQAKRAIKPAAKRKSRDHDLEANHGK